MDRVPMDDSASSLSSRDEGDSQNVYFGKRKLPTLISQIVDTLHITDLQEPQDYG